MKTLASVGYGRGSRVGEAVAGQLIAAAKSSISYEHGPAHEFQIRTLCTDIVWLGECIEHSDEEIDTQVRALELGRLLLSIPGLGVQTVGLLLSELGDPADFSSPGAVAAYCGVTPFHRQSGLWQPKRASIARMGNARLRRGLWMPMLNAVRSNPVLKAFFTRLSERGKPHKVAMTACINKLLHIVYSVAKNRRPFEARIPEETPPQDILVAQSPLNQRARALVDENAARPAEPLPSKDARRTVTRMGGDTAAQRQRSEEAPGGAERRVGPGRQGRRAQTQIDTLITEFA